MKNITNHMTYISLCILIITNSVLNLAAQTEKNKPLEAIWVGSLRIPNAAELRMGITISKNVDGTLSAALRIIDQNTGDIPCDVVKYEKDNILFKINHLGIEIEGTTDLENDTIESEFRQRGGKFLLHLKRVDKMPVLNRPQEPKRPFPYNEEEVEFENKKAGIKLAATLTFPKSDSPLPAVILITGSGQQDRNEEGFGHKPFLLITRTNLEGTWISGIFWEGTSHLTNHHPADCLHTVVNIGCIPRHSKRAIRGKIYWFRGTKIDLAKRFQRDFPE